MNRMDRFHTFHLKEDLARDNEIWPMLSYLAAFVQDRNTNLSSIGKTSVIEFDTHYLLVSRFEQSRPKVTVYLKRTSDDLMSQWVVLVH